MMHYARLLGAVEKQKGIAMFAIEGAPRRGPRHVAPRGEGNAQPARGPDRHGGHLFDLGERAHHRRGAGRLQPIEDIIDPIAESVDIIDVMRPIYNFKAS